MSILPEWAPNIHPLIVHFPITLLIIAVLIDLASLIVKNQKWLKNSATLLYATGAASALVTYFTGRNAADTVAIPAAANLIVNEHSDWALRTVVFFGILAVIRLAVSFKMPEPKLSVSVPLLVGGLAGLFLLYETAEHGAQLVFQQGVGVEAAENAQQDLLDALENQQVDAGIINFENGSWAWRPVQGAVTILEEQFTWYEGTSADISPEIVPNPEKTSALAFNLTGSPVMFTGGNVMDGMQADVTMNITEFTGSVMLVYHVQDAGNYDYIELDSDIQKLGRMENGTEQVLGEGEVPSTDGWITVRVFGGGGHFRGYVDEEQYSHGHADDLPPGQFGFRFNGTGTVLIESIQVQAVQ